MPALDIAVGVKNLNDVLANMRTQESDAALAKSTTTLQQLQQQMLGMAEGAVPKLDAQSRQLHDTWSKQLESIAPGDFAAAAAAIERMYDEMQALRDTTARNVDLDDHLHTLDQELALDPEVINDSRAILRDPDRIPGDRYRPPKAAERRGEGDARLHGARERSLRQG